ncbi:hypothetical protein NQ314_013107 [Rhamnusium bicolor]|uniref:PiggyBac transposable element-derived protein domain-containing protein n=1 Tax=Rhamnusium bicolor TaxID=1586634 RepID=A0AAV8X7L8_9CUCU|nr:hypothetical protein NQ314_013107 [Rhamnusium bicolor]
MSNNKRPLTECELQNEIDNLSDSEESVDDDQNDPDFTSEGSSETSYGTDASEQESDVEDSDNRNDSQEDVDLIWFKEVLNISRLPFTGQRGLQKDIPYNGEQISPVDVYKSIITQDVLDLMVMETNRYAGQLLNTRRISRTSRFSRWKTQTQMKWNCF